MGKEVTAEEPKTGEPGSETVVTDPSGDKVDPKEIKTFTQDQVDEIVQKRLIREGKKLAEFERKAKIYDGMMSDEEVTSFLEELATGKRTKKSEPEVDKKRELIGKLQKLDPEVGGVVTELLSLVEKEVESKVGKRVQKVEALTEEGKQLYEAEQAKKRYNDMLTSVDEEGKLKYPYLQHQEFKDDMASLLEGGRAFMLEDAYDLAFVARNRSGKLPKLPEEKKVKQRKAELLESEEAGGITTTSDVKNTDGSPKLFKSVEECIESLSKSRKWF